MARFGRIGSDIREVTMWDHEKHGCPIRDDETITDGTPGMLLILGEGGIDAIGPGEDAAGDVFHVGKPGVAQDK